MVLTLNLETYTQLYSSEVAAFYLVYLTKGFKPV